MGELLSGWLRASRLLVRDLTHRTSPSLWVASDKVPEVQQPRGRARPHAALSCRVMPRGIQGCPHYLRLGTASLVCHQLSYPSHVVAQSWQLILHQHAMFGAQPADMGYPGVRTCITPCSGNHNQQCADRMSRSPPAMISEAPCRTQTPLRNPLPRASPPHAATEEDPLPG